MEKLNLTQQKHTFTNQKRYSTTQNKQKKLKSGLVAFYDIRPGKGEGPVLILALHKFVPYLLAAVPEKLDSKPHAVPGL